MANILFCCTKYIIFVVNFLFCVIGLIPLGGGIYMKYSTNEYVQFFDKLIPAFAWTFIIVGMIIFVISFMGCCGAITENSCMLLSFSTTMLIIILLQLGLGIYAFVSLHKFVDDNFETALENGYKDNEIMRGAWDLFQSQAKCCGIDGPVDWTSLSGSYIVPDSCCEGWLKPNSTEPNHEETHKLNETVTNIEEWSKPIGIETNDEEERCNVNNAWQKGCKTVLMDFLNGLTGGAIGVLVAILIFEVITFFSGCCVYVGYRKKGYRPSNM